MNEEIKTPLLSISQGSKIYGSVYAIKDVSFDLYAGEVHALVGENGAGKSTLCKAIAGAIQLSSGQYLIDGRPTNFQKPVDALAAGIAMVYQETSLVPTMTVAQNIELGNEKILNRFRPLNIKAQQILQSHNFHVDPAVRVSTLGAAQRQMVEIARALRRAARIIVFDEPTATLTPEETRHFFQLMHDLKVRGVGIIYISHVLEESLTMADRITVLRDGKHIITDATANLDRDTLVRHMVGREVTQIQSRAGESVKKSRRLEKVLSVENLTMGNVVKNMSFSVYAGEVLGISGLIGSGRTETAKIIFGALKRNLLRGGRIYFKGEAIRFRVPSEAVNKGIAYISEDRKANGFFETLPVAENIYIGKLATRNGWSFLSSTKAKVELAKHWVQKIKITSIDRTAKISQLSGGNQQKVMIAKSLVQEPTLIIFDEPTRGVDVGTIPQIHQTIRDLAAEGKAVVVISSYLPEILAISDRILVARQGRIVEEFSFENATEASIMYAAIH